MRLGLAIAAFAACLLSSGGALAQVTFQSGEVLGVSSADREKDPGALKRYPDRTVRFWSNDGRTYFLDGYGCRFEMATWPEGAEAEPGAISAVLRSDIDSYRRSSSGAVAEAGQLNNVFMGMLYRAGPGPSAGKDSYGLECSDKKATAIALDVLKTATYRQLRIFVVQADTEDFEAGKPVRKAMVVSFMENTLFRQGDPETLSVRAPLAAGLYDALRN